MITEVHIRNFQSIKEADIEVAPLTLFVGDNRAGKSAIQRAIQAACFNWTGTSFIRRGQKECSVSLVLNNGDGRRTEVTWTKNKSGSAEYLIDVDGEQRRFTKLGASVPDEVADELGFARIEVDKTLTLTPQFHTQMLDPFLIDKSPGQAARALAKLTRLDVVVGAQGLIRTDLRGVKQDHAACEKLITSLTAEEEEFADLDAEVQQVSTLSDRADALPGMLSEIRTGKELLERYRRAQRDSAIELPSLDRLLRLNEGRLACQDAYADYNDAAHRLAALPETLPNIPAFGEKLDQLRAMRLAFRGYGDASVGCFNAEDALGQFEHAMQADIERWNAIDLCPTCGQPLQKIEAVA